ncbi:MAG: amidophosphoribosyltransferase [Clostridia bacterium]|uniref:amidophosphoribosyltransferase n=1 Tax=Desulfitibacter alkalitolerans TaxID=264641 RepID=UPI000482BD35|nr:amidophosphoribosyltransferase [Desulfitibacter alkalitolerans]MBS3969997.1 amidophosphoribosyltransferase [Clostridia bacterium]
MFSRILHDKPKEECGVFGIYAPGIDVDAAQLTYYGLYALQHRGQDSAGIAVSNSQSINVHKGLGLVAQVFNENNLKQLKGSMAVGHVRYSTTGASSLENAQPVISRFSDKTLCLAHNGNLTNTNELRQHLAKNKVFFQTTSDSEIILQLISQNSTLSLTEAVKMTMHQIKGAYSLVIMTENQLIGARDPKGMRPLCFGTLGEGYVLASESCALDAVGAQFSRDVKPGEIITIDQAGIKSTQFPLSSQRSLCIFEYIYLARVDSVIDGESVNQVRRNLGKALAQEYFIHADMVIPVPDSGITSALGYTEESGLPYKEGLTKNRYAGRTFIQPGQELRELGVKLKFNPIKDILKGQGIVMVDDSLVRGTTCRQIVKMLRQAGVMEVHLLVASPPILCPCYYGIDIASPDQLVAARFNQEEIRRFIGADSLHYLSLNGLFSALKAPREEFCSACFNGTYPTEMARSI